MHHFHSKGIRSMWVADSWQDYELLDTGDGMKLERWKDILLLRPDPQVIWPFTEQINKKNIHAVYKRSSSGGGSWDFIKKVPPQWNIHWQELTFTVRPMGFKHTGLFPEQAINWEWMRNLIPHCRQRNQGAEFIRLYRRRHSSLCFCRSKGMPRRCSKKHGSYRQGKLSSLRLGKCTGTVDR